MPRLEERVPTATSAAATPACSVWCYPLCHHSDLHSESLILTEAYRRATRRPPSLTDGFEAMPVVKESLDLGESVLFVLVWHESPYADHAHPAIAGRSVAEERGRGTLTSHGSSPPAVVVGV